jgi:hypothetical protein
MYPGKFLMAFIEIKINFGISDRARKHFGETRQSSIYIIYYTLMYIKKETQGGAEASREVFLFVILFLRTNKFKKLLKKKNVRAVCKVFALYQLVL